MGAAQRPTATSIKGRFGLAMRLGKSFTMNVLAMAAALFFMVGLGMAQQLSPEPVVDSDAYAVYSTVLPLRELADPIVIQRETITQITCTLPSGGSFDHEWRPVLESFIANQKRPGLLERRFAFAVPHELLSAAELTTLVGNDWTRFRTRYPAGKGYFAVSRVAFDASNTRAMLWIEHQCGFHCAKGTFHFAEKREGKWVLATVDGETCLTIA